MSRNTLTEGIREVFRDPALLLIEIGWRWTFGVIAVLLFGPSIFRILDKIKLDPRGLDTLTTVNPLQLGRQIGATLPAFGAALLRVVLVAGVILIIFWVILSALGRNATLARPALMHGRNAGLRTSFASSLSRVLVTIACAVTCLLTATVAAFIASTLSRNALPNFGLIAAISLVALLLVGGVGFTLNWLLSLAPLFGADQWHSCVADTVKFVRCCRDELLEISIVSTVIGAAWLIVSLLLSFAVASVVRSPRMLLADLLAIALLYFLGADFLYVARLVAYGRLRKL
ncbi:MAG TPA: hypothetical protein VJ453_08525 [Terriglobales bacterium]|jgi:hypothetical protein|nr:hypothetical protein [Terriglobales bacterium]